MHSRPLVFVSDDVYLKHCTPEGHQESPQRVAVISREVKRSALYNRMLHLQPRQATLDELALVHQRGYIRLAEAECLNHRPFLSTGDTDICPESFAVALQAAGGVLVAVDSVMTGAADQGFCAVRPPGHHAGIERGMGFCLFNNVAIAARYAQKKHGVERVLIADWDVHHGNGTQEIFWKDGSVFFFSTHQWPLYPGTGSAAEIGEGKGRGCIMNRPFPVGAGNDEIIDVFSNDLLRAANNFRPDLTLISAGFDSRIHDPLGGFRIDDSGFRQLTKIMLEIAHIAGAGRLVSVLEGGYNLTGLASAVLAHLAELTG